MAGSGVVKACTHVHTVSSHYICCHETYLSSHITVAIGHDLINILCVSSFPNLNAMIIVLRIVSIS